MPSTPAKIQEQLGISGEITEYESAKSFGLLTVGTRVEKGEAIFPRMDIKKEIESLEASQPKEEKEKESEQTQEIKQITYDDFAKLELKVGKVLSCSELENSDKLLILSVEIGNETRTIVSGIKKWYKPEQLTGKEVVVVCNLKPVKLRGVVSEGMILSAEDADGRLSIIAPTQMGFPSGPKVM